MKDNFKKILLCGLALLITFSAASATTFAANPGLTTDGTAPLTKRVRIPYGMDIPNSTFVFEFYPGPLGSNQTIPSPDVNNMLAPQEHNLLKIDVDNTVPISGWETGGYQYADITIPNMFANTAFPHADVYSYIVIEGNAHVNSSTGTINLNTSQCEYIINVHVANDGAGGLKVKYVEFHKEIDDDGSVFNPPVKTELLFVNTFSQTATLEISKKVTGSYADLTQEFDFLLGLMRAAAGESPTSVYQAIHYTASGGQTPMSFPLGYTNFKLKHGEKIVFLDLPVGTGYLVSEDGVAGYLTSLSVENISETGVYTNVMSTQGISAGDSVSAGIGSPLIIAGGENKNLWVNEYLDPAAPTGIIMDNLPFILLILVAVGGFIIYITLKRRKARR